MRDPRQWVPQAHTPLIAEVKPILMDKPEHFKGAHDDIKRFLGDCVTYFEVFQ